MKMPAIISLLTGVVSFDKKGMEFTSGLGAVWFFWWSGYMLPLALISLAYLWANKEGHI